MDQRGYQIIEGVFHWVNLKQYARSHTLCSYLHEQILDFIF